MGEQLLSNDWFVKKLRAKKLVIKCEAQELFVLIADCKHHQLRSKVMREVFNVPIVGGDHILPIDQETHNEVFARENLKACNCSYLCQVGVRTVFEDELEKHIESVGAVLGVLLDRFILLLFIFF